MTSSITSTYGTFLLYLIKHLDEWGISLGGGILQGVRAVIPLLFSLHDCLGESCKLPLPVDLIVRWQARHLSTTVGHYLAKKHSSIIYSTVMCSVLVNHATEVWGFFPV